MNREAVADRIVTYSDALVAFSLVNGLAFLVALGEPDIRCSIARISGTVIVANVFFPIASTFLLIWLKRYERRLREGATPDELVSRFWSAISIFRLVLVWSFASVVLFGIWGATLDRACLAGHG